MTRWIFLVAALLSVDAKSVNLFMRNGGEIEGEQTPPSKVMPDTDPFEGMPRQLEVSLNLRPATFEAAPMTDEEIADRMAEPLPALPSRSTTRSQVPVIDENSDDPFEAPASRQKPSQ